MPIYKLQFENLGPFDKIQFEFDPQINVFIGPNNSGKSTVLMALANLAVRGFFLPKKLLKRPKAPFEVHQGRAHGETKTLKGVFPTSYSLDFWCMEGDEFWNRYQKEAAYACLIPALRWSSDYRAESASSERADSPGKRHALPDFVSLVQHGWIELDSSKPHASIVRDTAIIQKIIDLDYRSYREKNPAIRALLSATGAIASEITSGFPIEFAGVDEDKEGLYPAFKTPDGVVPINVLSQGTQSLIQWLGLLLIGYAEYYEFPKDLKDKPGIAIIDEIDAHMHPSWQRRILPALSRNFPNLQIFCSSHSPFVLAGLQAGQAQLLSRDEKGKVGVSRNQTDLVGWSIDEILRNFLDIANPTDLQTSENVDRLQELRNKKRLTKKQKDELEQLRETLNRDLMAGPASDEVERLAEKARNPVATSSSRRKGPPAKKKAKKKFSKATGKTPAKRTRRRG